MARRHVGGTAENVEASPSPPRSLPRASPVGVTVLPRPDGASRAPCDRSAIARLPSGRPSSRAAPSEHSPFGYDPDRRRRDHLVEIAAGRPFGRLPPKPGVRLRESRRRLPPPVARVIPRSFVGVYASLPRGRRASTDRRTGAAAIPCGSRPSSPPRAIELQRNFVPRPPLRRSAP